MSTQGKGNFTFKILKNGATESDLDPVDNQSDEPEAKLSNKELDQVSGQRSDVVAGGDKPLGSEKSLGRKRRG